MKTRSCPICLNTKLIEIYKNNLAAIDILDMSYIISRCSKCGFHFAGKLPSDQDYDVYYRKFSKYDSGNSISHLDSLRVNEAIAFIDPLVPKNYHILDIGCGGSTFLAALQKSGWSNINGIDPGQSAADSANVNFGIKSVRTGSLNNLKNLINLEKINLVCLMAVLEHLPNLRQDLEVMLTNLRPKTKILIEVPAIEGFCADKAEPFGEFSIEHINFFSFQSIRNLFSQLKLRIIKEHRQELPHIKSSSAFVYAELLEEDKYKCKPLNYEEACTFAEYIRASNYAFLRSLKKIPSVPFILYGAGSHSARLIPRLKEKESRLIFGVVDGNRNLIGKKLGEWTVNQVGWLRSHPNLPVVISSYRSQYEIAAHLQKEFKNPIVLLYDD